MEIYNAEAQRRGDTERISISSSAFLCLCVSALYILWYRLPHGFLLLYLCALFVAHYLRTEGIQCIAG